MDRYEFDPANVHEAMAEQVNQVFRNMADNPLSGKVIETQGMADAPDVSQEARDILAEIYRFMESDAPPSVHIVVECNVVVAGEVLSLAIGLACTHQVEDHPDRPWIGCHPYTELVDQACRLYIQALANARRR